MFGAHADGKLADRVARLVFVMFTGVFLLGLYHLSLGLDMSGSATSCPFMAHQEVVCTMDTLSHLNAWETVMLAIVPAVLLLLVHTTRRLLSSQISVAAPRVYWRYRACRLPREIRERAYDYFVRPLQELFARGILHPQLFS